MPDEVISIEEVIAYSLNTLPDLIEDWNWGERSLFHNPTTSFRRARTSSPSRRKAVQMTPSKPAGVISSSALAGSVVALL